MGSFTLKVISMKSCWVLLFGLSVALASQKSYEGYKVFRTQSLTPEQAQALQKLENTFDFWKPVNPGTHADILAPPHLTKYLQNIFHQHKIGHHEYIENVQSLIHAETKKAYQKYDGKINFDQYYSHDDLNAYIEDLAAQNADFLSVTSIGKSVEGRDMKVLHITKAGPGKPNIWIEAGIHAREWISPAMCTYIIDSLMNNDVDDFKSQLNFHILPSANPDGYEYSREHDRLWRKNRGDHGSIFLCKGVDLNRNWGFHFAESGASNNKCTETYHGPEAFSEPETANIRDYTLTLDPVPVLSHTLHSYSQLWLWPYGYAYDAYPENYVEIRDLAKEAVDALQAVHGTVFDPINSADLYPAAGASDDWYKGVLGSRFAYTTELRDTGRHGFILPPEEIKPSGEELWEAERVVLKKMIEVSNE